MQAFSTFIRIIREVTLAQQIMLTAGILFCIGVIMIGSASMGVAEHIYGREFYFLLRHVTWLVLGFLVAIFLTLVPMSVWEKHSGWLLLIGILLLVFVLIPGVGRRVNGSSRWIGFGSINMQPSEVAKFAVVIYMAHYLVKHKENIRTGTKSFLFALGILGVVGLLLLMEPDFGATMVTAIAMMGMIFLAGVSIKKYAASVSLLVVSGIVLLLTEEYRLRRLKVFLDPWKEKYDDGYQLTQSLIAFGRGDWFGVGLGKSVQKMFYLPEAHTDFVFAIYAEEFGLVGIFFLLLVFALLVRAIMKVGQKAEVRQQFFSAYVAYGFGFLIVTQVAVNVSVNMGLLPTKGLTLPLISYGGSSMLAIFAMLALLLRIERENTAAVVAPKGGRA